jgi:DNA polymerase-3 subunit chi
MLLDGATLDFQQAAALKRVWVLFEEEDTAGRQMARDLWSRLGKSGLATQYWAEEAGTWTKKMDRPATHQV